MVQLREAGRNLSVPMHTAYPSSNAECLSFYQFDGQAVESLCQPKPITQTECLCRPEQFGGLLQALAMLGFFATILAQKLGDFGIGAITRPGFVQRIAIKFGLG